MTSRERVNRAIQFQKPDRPPISHAILPSAQYHYGDELSKIINSFHEDFGWHLLPDLPPENYRHSTNWADTKMIGEHYGG